MEPVEAEPFKTLSEIVTVANVGCSLVFSSLGQKALKAVNLSKLVVADARGLGTSASIYISSDDFPTSQANGKLY
jgi:hypothetical protein